MNTSYTQSLFKMNTGFDSDEETVGENMDVPSMRCPERSPIGGLNMISKLGVHKDNKSPSSSRGKRRFSLNQTPVYYVDDGDDLSDEGEDTERSSLDDFSEASIISSRMQQRFEFVMETNEHGEEQGNKEQSKISVFAESPYYDNFVEEEMDCMQLASATLKDIHIQTAAFAKAGNRMSKATKKLSACCRLETPGGNPEEAVLRQRKMKALGPEIAFMLHRLGEALNEIASVQHGMCKIVEETVGSTHLEDIATSNFETAKQLKQESEEQSQIAEELLSNYINEKPQGDDDDDASFVSGISASIGKLSWFQGSNNTHKQPLKKNMHERSRSMGGYYSSSNHDDESDRDVSSSSCDLDVDMAVTRKTCEEIAMAEFKRFQLYKYIVSVKSERADEICRTIHDDFFSKVSKYFEECHQIFVKLQPDMKEVHKNCCQLRIENQTEKEEVWKECENSIVRIVTEIAAEADEQSVQSYKSNREAWANSLSLGDDNEIQSLVWKMPAKLHGCCSSSSSTNFYIEPKSDIALQGWLYQRIQPEKGSGRKLDNKIGSSRPCVWKKKWFVLKKDGLFYLDRENVAIVEAITDSNDNNSHPSGKNKKVLDKDSNNEKTLRTIAKIETLTEVKVCDLITSMGKMTSLKGSNYSFQVSSLKQKPIILQARGPSEQRNWIEKIREVMRPEYVTIAI